MNAKQRIKRLEKACPPASTEKPIETIRAEIQAKLERLARGEPIEPNTEPNTEAGEAAKRWILERLARIGAAQNEQNAQR